SFQRMANVQRRVHAQGMALARIPRALRTWKRSPEEKHEIQPSAGRGRLGVPLMRGAPSSPARLVLWYGCALALAVLLPSAKFGAPLWQLPEREMLSALTLMGAFLISAVVPGIAVLRGASLSRVAIVVTTLAVFSLVFLGLLLTGAAASKTVLLAFFALA